jgi:hypothetical protein
MSSKIRIITILMGAAFTLQGIAWIVVPDRAAAGLGMPVLDGLARSTQFGDFAAFFLTLGLSILAGSTAGRARALYFPAALLASAALCRTIAWAVHGADFAALFIAVEAVGAIILLSASRQPRRAVRRVLQ